MGRGARGQPARLLPRDPGLRPPDARAALRADRADQLDHRAARLQPRPRHYSASKAGINGLIRAAAIELAPYGITVNGVEPGNILTEGMQAERSPEFIRAMERSVPLGRLGTPRDVAHAVLFLASDEAAYITGTTIVVDGGQILPEAKV